MPCAQGWAGDQLGLNQLCSLRIKHICRQWEAEALRTFCLLQDGQSKLRRCSPSVLAMGLTPCPLTHTHWRRCSQHFPSSVHPPWLFFLFHAWVKLCFLPCLACPFLPRYSECLLPVPLHWPNSETSLCPCTHTSDYKSLYLSQSTCEYIAPFNVSL